MKMVIDIPNFVWIEDIKDFKSAVKEYDKGSAFDYAIREALLLGTPLPKNHSRKWKEVYAESEGSNSWIEFKCPHCGRSFGMESGEYDWHYGDEIPWKYCPIRGGSAEHNPYKGESEE